MTASDAARQLWNALRPGFRYERDFERIFRYAKESDSGGVVATDDEERRQEESELTRLEREWILAQDLNRLYLQERDEARKALELLVAGMLGLIDGVKRARMPGVPTP